MVSGKKISEKNLCLGTWGILCEINWAGIWELSQTTKGKPDVSLPGEVGVCVYTEFINLKHARQVDQI